MMISSVRVYLPLYNVADAPYHPKERYNHDNVTHKYKITREHNMIALSGNWIQRELHMHCTKKGNYHTYVAYFHYIAR